ncbi:hypothetical protein OHV52_18280, partial [Acinetobacter baumannii]|nr:hypothetical protein [Acinetobacter baumannii]
KKTQLINNSIFKLKNLLSAINPFFKDLNFVFLLDEFENIESSYKKVINNFVRMAEPGYSFRVAGRKESNNFNETYNEQNLSGHEFILVDLDEIYRTEHSRKIHETEIRKFISDFIKKNLSFINEHAVIDVEKLFGKEDDYKEYINNSFLVQEKNIKLYKNIKEEFIKSIDIEKSNASLIFNILNENITSLILIKLNILRFGKTKKLNDKNLIETARNINNDAINYQNGSIKKSSYSNALNHYKSDILCQLFHMENPQNLPIYYGFDTLCKITSYNPRNVLNILYKIEEQLLFENKDFFSNNFIDIKTQSRAYRESSRYYFNEDTSYGSISMQAKQATKRIGDYLQAARFSLKIPESSPLAISFSENYLNKTTWKIYNACIEFSLLQVMGSRNDRNKHHRNIKLRLNPMLSPIWNLPTSYRGDLSINKDLTEMIFDPSKHDDFYKELNKVKARWNKISFTASKTDILEPLQGDLFR